MHGDKDHLDGRMRFFQLCGRVDTIQERHRHIENHNVGLNPLCRLKKRPSVLDHPDQVALIVKNAAKPFEHQRMIVRQ